VVAEHDGEGSFLYRKQN